MLQSLLADIQALGWLDWLITATALVYVVLAARENPWCWAWGGVSCGLWGYVSFTRYDLWLDALLQVYYVGMSGYGLYQWVYSAADRSPRAVVRWPLKRHLGLFAVGIPLSLLFGYLFGAYTPAAATYLDAFTTVFAVLTTYLVARKVLENWYYWIAIDLALCYLYASRGAWLFALLMVVYIGIAAWGLARWRKAVPGAAVLPTRAGS